MKRIFYILVALIPLLSCEDGTDAVSGGKDSLAGECVLPASARVGGEVIVQWNGFKAHAAMFLASPEGERRSVEDLYVTSSGVSFRVPVSVSPGVYGLILEQDGETKLGDIDILYPDMPIVGLTMPSYAESGAAVIVGGAGFDTSSVLILVDSDGNETVLETSVVNAGLSVEVPGNVRGAIYSLYLEQDGLRWLLSSSFRIIRVGGDVKRLVSIHYFSPYIGSTEFRVSWDITYGPSESLRFTEATVSDGKVTVSGYDDYVSVSDGCFKLIDGLAMSNDLEISYMFDEQGRVSLASVLLYGDDEPTDFTWNYDAGGYLRTITYESASSGTRTFRSLEYEEGNLTVFRSTAFHYDNPELFNAPGAADVVWGFMSLVETTEPSVHIPYLLGLYTKTSANLPTAMTMDTGTPTRVNLSYEFDEDGYVTCMSWKQGRDNERLVFVYDFI